MVLDDTHTSVPLLQLLALGDVREDVERLRQADATLHEEADAREVELGTLCAA